MFMWSAVCLDTFCNYRSRIQGFEVPCVTARKRIHNLEFDLQFEVLVVWYSLLIYCAEMTLKNSCHIVYLLTNMLWNMEFNICLHFFIFYLRVQCQCYGKKGWIQWEYEGANDSEKGRVVILTFADGELVSHLFILKCIFSISMPVKASFVFLFDLNASYKCPSRNQTTICYLHHTTYIHTYIHTYMYVVFYYWGEQCMIHGSRIE
jgi:hypothetical protein